MARRRRRMRCAVEMISKSHPLQNLALFYSRLKAGLIGEVVGVSALPFTARTCCPGLAQPQLGVALDQQASQSALARPSRAG